MAERIKVGVKVHKEMADKTRREFENEWRSLALNTWMWRQYFASITAAPLFTQYDESDSDFSPSGR